MCFHLCKPLICYLFITTAFQITVDFMTRWNGGSKRALFFHLELFALRECETWLSPSSDSHQPSKNLRLVFPSHVAKSQKWHLQYSFFISLLSDWDVDHSSKVTCERLFFHRCVTQKWTLTASYCVFRQHIVGGGLSPLTLMERHRFYGARLYWPVGDIYFLVS